MIPLAVRRVIDFIFSNKFLLSVFAFAIWMVFADGDRLMDRFSLKREINKLKSDRELYLQRIAEDRQKLDDLSKNRFSLERVAREKYFMHQSNEMVFVVPQKTQTE